MLLSVPELTQIYDKIQKIHNDIDNWLFIVLTVRESVLSIFHVASESMLQ